MDGDSDRHRHSTVSLQTAVQAMKVIGPQDYSGDINVTVSARAAEAGADPSPYASGNFKVSLTAVAEPPTFLFQTSLMLYPMPWKMKPNPSITMDFAKASWIG